MEIRLGSEATVETVTADAPDVVVCAGGATPEAPAFPVTGGGRHNKTLMGMLRAQVDAPVIAAEEARWNGDAMEAEGFAYLAMRSKRGLALSLPTTTGVPAPMTGGTLHRR